MGPERAEWPEELVEPPPSPWTRGVLREAVRVAPREVSGALRRAQRVPALGV